MPPRRGFRAPGVADLTGGRPDTPEWAAFLRVADQDNPDDCAYFEGLESWADRGLGVRWIVPLIWRLSWGYEGYTLDKAQRTVNHILDGG